MPFLPHHIIPSLSRHGASSMCQALCQALGIQVKLDVFYGFETIGFYAGMLTGK